MEVSKQVMSGENQGAFAGGLPGDDKSRLIASESRADVQKQRLTCSHDGGKVFQISRHAEHTETKA